MKTLFLLVLLGAGAVFGGAFFGVLTIPGLEEFPTVNTLGKQRATSVERGAERAVNSTVKDSAWGRASSDRVGTRASQLRSMEKELE